ncbi:4-(cytidine 5'-diphospho)-2-C-methyl-D-erythritol kinase [Pseudohaliea rubra]|uniref:4-(cytidine 5'-diphospho)-2-C-methyl-D-erythritol kinase n=1 Tax=Pseudohaliea rubra TaxID=475795 RepID=UPI0005528530|nr:4-(cytidine 5'-diphospho)-2-C-methyl-D-erythritol kinase [Pseudohaliea rubra]
MSAQTVTLAAPAKLNLFLHVTGRREDGYHTLQTVFQLLAWGDTVTLEAREDGAVTLAGPDLDIASDDNLAVRAARALKALPGTSPDNGVHITLDKRIPTGGGLGGGSSDAASTLLGLIRLWKLDVSRDRLAAIGATLGADVPVFVRGHSAWAEGIGEQLQPVLLPPAWFLIIHPGVHVDTGEIFSRRELTRDSPPITMAAFFAGTSRNDCEPVVRNLYAEVDNALIWLGKFGDAKLTGTGACVFCRCADEASARAIAAEVPAPWRAIVAAGVNRSPAL